MKARLRVLLEDRAPVVHKQRLEDHRADHDDSSGRLQLEPEGGPDLIVDAGKAGGDAADHGGGDHEEAEEEEEGDVELLARLEVGVAEEDDGDGKDYGWVGVR